MFFDMSAGKASFFATMQKQCGSEPGHLEFIWTDIYFSVEMDNGLGLMTNWYEKPRAGWLMRLGGLMLIGISMLASMALYRHVNLTPRHQATPIEFLLTVVAFLACSAGSAMAVLGQHLFDRVQVSSRSVYHHSRRPDDGSKGWW